MPTGFSVCLQYVDRVLNMLQVLNIPESQICSDIVIITQSST